ncbi:unnamed protein product [Brassica rapa subsp. narinosa]
MLFLKSVSRLSQDSVFLLDSKNVTIKALVDSWLIYGEKQYYELLRVWS